MQPTTKFRFSRVFVPCGRSPELSGYLKVATMLLNPKLAMWKICIFVICSYVMISAFEILQLLSNEPE